MQLPGRLARWKGDGQNSPLPGAPGTDASSPQPDLFRDLTVVFGLLAVLSAILGLAGMHFGITILSSVYPGYRTIALSAALIWIVTGSLLSLNSLRPLRGAAAKAAMLVLGAIILLEAFELPLNIFGGHSAIEDFLTGIGALFLGPSSSPISPVASALIIGAAVSLFLIVRDPGKSPQNRSLRDAVGICGSIMGITSFTFVLSYIFGDPLLYGTQFIPMAAISALAAFFLGTGLVTAAGPEAVPLRYVTGATTRARLLRIFLPLFVGIILVQQIVFSTMYSHNLGRDAILTAGSLVIFVLVTGFFVSRISVTLGNALDRAEAELVRKNEDLGAMNEELIALEEELRQNIEELGKSETALRESLFFARNVLNNLFSFVGVTTPGGVLVEANRAPMEAAGITADECLNRFFWDGYWWCYDAEVQAKIRASCERAAAGETSRFDIQARMAGGSLMWIDYQIAPLRDSTGRIINLIPSGIDITERKRWEEALRESEQGLARSQMIAHLGSWDLDLVNNRLSWSDEVYRIFGLRPQEFRATYEAFLDAVHPEDRAAVDAAYSASLREGKDSYTIDHRVIQKDTGKVRHVHEKCEHLRDETGKIIRSAGMVHDITERKAAEEALRRAHDELEHRVQERTKELNLAVGAIGTERRRLYDVLETLPVYVCLLDRDYRMPFANKYFRDTFGYSETRCCHDFLFGLGKPCDTCETFTVMKTRAPHHWYWKGPNGRDYDIYDFPFYDTDGALLILEMGIDITVQKKAQEDLRKSHDILEERVRERTSELAGRNEDLNAANEELSCTQEELQQNLEELSRREHELSEALAEKDVLLSEIHHRVKNNLSAFISLLSLEGSYDDSPAGATLKKDLQNRARSMALIHETLYRTRKYSTVEMDLYLKTLVGQVTGTYALPGKLHVEVEAGGIVLDLSRATTCGLIVNELVTNSFKYAFSAPFDCTDPNGRTCIIAVTLQEEGEKYVLRIRDNGIGLPAGFDARNARSLGLKLVNFLAKHQLRATVDVRSGPGTEFELRFPVNQQFRKDP
jgi:PAS domain S-box-containing protein